MSLVTLLLDRLSEPDSDGEAVDRIEVSEPCHIEPDDASTCNLLNLRNGLMRCENGQREETRRKDVGKAAFGW